MGTLIAQTIVDRAWVKALDRGATKRYTAEEALLWLNDAQRDIVTRRHEANTVTATVVPNGATARQTLPGLGLTRGVAIIDVLRNQNGTVAGRAVSKKSREWFDVARPSWTTETGSQVRHWMDDASDPLAFWVWPIPLDYALVIQAAEAPAPLGSLAVAITLGDSYAKAMELYLLSQFFAKNMTANRNPQLAQFYTSEYLAALGIRDQRDQLTGQKADIKTAGG